MYTELKSLQSTVNLAPRSLQIFSPNSLHLFLQDELQIIYKKMQIWSAQFKKETLLSGLTQVVSPALSRWARRVACKTSKLVPMPSTFTWLHSALSSCAQWHLNKGEDFVLTSQNLNYKRASPLDERGICASSCISWGYCTGTEDVQVEFKSDNTVQKSSTFVNRPTAQMKHNETT